MSRNKNSFGDIKSPLGEWCDDHSVIHEAVIEYLKIYFLLRP